MNLEIPDTGLVEQFSIYRKRKPTVTLAVRRNVVNPVLFRNTQSDRAETQELNGVIRAQVNGEKFVAKERLSGLALLRHLSDEFGDENDEEWSADADALPAGLISPDYAYNEPEGIATSTNMDALTYGLAGTGTQEFGIRSHVIEGYTYSTEEYDLMNKETRNAVYESGTMQTDEGDHSKALFEHVMIHPGNSFVHFITLEAATPAMLLYTMHNILNTSKYGARDTRTGRNMSNEIIGIICGNQDTSLSPGEFLLNHHEPGEDITAAVNEYIQSVRRTDWQVYGDGLADADDFPDWAKAFQAVAS